MVRSIVALVARLVLFVLPSQRRSPHWRLMRLVQRTYARVPVRLPMPGGALTVPLGDYMHHDLVTTGDYEPETRSLLERLCRPGMTVIDAGAHVGYYSLVMARAVGPTGTVHAFEADPCVARWTGSNVRKAGLRNVVVNAVALSDHEGHATFHVGSDSEVSSLAAPRADLYTARPMTVPVTTLASYMAANQLTRIDVMKMDVEGAELPALRGLCRHLWGRGAPVILVEFAPERQRAFGASSRELADFLRSAGYRLYRVGSMDSLPEEPPEAIYNVLAIPPD